MDPAAAHETTDAQPENLVGEGELTGTKEESGCDRKEEDAPEGSRGTHRIFRSRGVRILRYFMHWKYKGRNAGS